MMHVILASYYPARMSIERVKYASFLAASHRVPANADKLVDFNAWLVFI